MKGLIGGADGLVPSSCRRSYCIIIMGTVCLLALVLRYNSSSDDGCHGGCFRSQKVVSGNQGSSGGSRVSTSPEGLPLGTLLSFDMDEDEDDGFEEVGKQDDEVVSSVDNEDDGTKAKLVESEEDEKDPEVIATLAEFDKQVKEELETAKAEAVGEDEPDAPEEEEEEVEDHFTPFQEDSIAMGIRKYGEKLQKLDKAYLQVSEEDAAALPADDGIHVITTFFRGTYHDARFKEIMATLVSNLENPYITALHVLWEVADPLLFIPAPIADRIRSRGLHKKLVLTEVKRQPTYKVLFRYADTKLTRGSIAIVTNADIYFDESLKCVSLPPSNYTTLRYKPEKIKTRMALSLSRRHSSLCGKMNDDRSRFDVCKQYTLSHDTFIFAPPVPKPLIAHTDHTQNQGYGAENIVIYEFNQLGYKVQNPCFTIRAYHLHCSRERHYVARIINTDPPRRGAALPIKRKCGTLWVY